MTTRARWLILGFALLGLAFAGSATYVHYRLLTEPNYVSPCDINATFNCSEVYLSRYGSVMRVPVALGGLIWFAVVALIAGLGRPRNPAASKDDPAGAYVFALSTVALAAVLYLGYTSFVVLKHACLLCIGTYVAVAGLFIVSGATASVPIVRLPGRLLQDLRALVSRPATLLATLAFLVGATSVVAYFPKEATAPPATTVQGSDSAQKNFDTVWAAQQRIDLGIPADGAKVVIVKFNDWQCPSCRLAHVAYQPVFDKYASTMPGTIKYVLKDYPLSSKCNFNIAREMHPAACEAAAAVRLANEKGQSNAMVDWLFSDQASLTPASVQTKVKSLLGVEDFDRQYARLLPDIKRDAADGGALQVQYTPTYYINGVKAQAAEGAWLPAEYFDYAIQYELRKAGAMSPAPAPGAPAAESSPARGGGK